MIRSLIGCAVAEIPQIIGNRPNAIRGGERDGQRRRAHVGRGRNHRRQLVRQQRLITGDRKALIAGGNARASDRNLPCSVGGIAHQDLLDGLVLTNDDFA